MSATPSMNAPSPEILVEQASGIHEAFAALGPSPGSRVLVIAESPAVRWLTQGQLTRLGCSAVTTGDGVTGLELGLRGTFDIVIVTENLPSLSGLAICQVLSVLPDDRRPLIIFHVARTKNAPGSTGADLVLSDDGGADSLVAWVRVYLARINGDRTRTTCGSSANGTLVMHPGLLDDHAWAGNGIV